MPRVSVEPIIYPNHRASSEMTCEVGVKIGDKLYVVAHVRITKEDNTYISAIVTTYNPFRHVSPEFLDWTYISPPVPVDRRFEDIKFVAATGESSFSTTKFGGTFFMVLDDSDGDEIERSELCNVHVSLRDRAEVRIRIETQNAATTRTVYLPKNLREYE